MQRAPSFSTAASVVSRTRTDGPCTGRRRRLSGDAQFTTLPVPTIDSVTSTNLTASSADLNAKIDPNGYDAGYRFEYGTSTAYGTSVPVPDSDITPPRKNGALIGNGKVLFATPPDFSEDGLRVVLTSVQCFGGAVSCPALREKVAATSFEFERSSRGWVTTSLALPATQFNANGIVSLSAEAGTALFSAPTSSLGEDDLYARHPDGSLVDVGPVLPPGGTEGIEVVPYRTIATADLSHIVYFIYERGWPFDETLFDTASKPESPYEYVGRGIRSLSWSVLVVAQEARI
jgi:hypothetical protein